MSDYYYTRTCPECFGSGHDDVSSLVVCSRCEGDGVIDVYVESEDDAPAILFMPEDER